MSIVLTILTLAFKHVWLNKCDTKSLLKLYSPQQVNGNLFCKVGINNYVRSVILLSNSKENINGIYNIEDKNLLLFTESEKIVLKLILWNYNNEKCLEEFVGYLDSFGVCKKIYVQKNNEI